MNSIMQGWRRGDSYATEVHNERGEVVIAQVDLYHDLPKEQREEIARLIIAAPGLKADLDELKAQNERKAKALRDIARFIEPMPYAALGIDENGADYKDDLLGLIDEALEVKDE